MNTFWNANHNLTPTFNDLFRLIPASGSVEKAHKNPKLERLRKMSNAYRDIFNNGGMNRARSISKFFPGVMRIIGNDINTKYTSTDIRREGWNKIHGIVEPIMAKAVMAAAAEQEI